MPYIELWGPPGSGKTTLAQKMIAADNTLSPGRRSLAGPKDGRLKGPFPSDLSLWRLVSGAPCDFLIAFRFFREVKDVSSAWRLCQLLMQGRMLRASRKTWIIDQGLFQHVLTVVAQAKLSEEAGKRWLTLFNNPPYAADKVLPVNVPLAQLRIRIANSEKHRQQQKRFSSGEYAEQMHSVFNQLQK